MVKFSEKEDYGLAFCVIVRFGGNLVESVIVKTRLNHKGGVIVKMTRNLEEGVIVLVAHFLTMNWKVRMIMLPILTLSLIFHQISNQNVRLSTGEHYNAPSCVCCTSQPAGKEKGRRLACVQGHVWCRSCLCVQPSSWARHSGASRADAPHTCARALSL
jgi:hypothetical protein